uniref:7TM_GPCR_Srx domain-containing protein n=1 Tax=Heterorhabditis bacteriophora TaxID=37862 RepID=A0A1I7W9F1_HETBA
MINTRFVMNIISLAISIEKMCSSINLIYQFSSYDIFVRGENKTFVGQIVLISIQTGHILIYLFSKVPLEVPFFRLGNGPFALAVFIVQLCCSCYPRMLVASSILQVIIGALALFTLSPAITNVYYLVSSYCSAKLHIS